MKYALLFFLLLSTFLFKVKGQIFSAQLITEGHYDFKQRANLCNLIRVDLNIPVYNLFYIDLAGINIYNLKNERIVEDLLGYSNIEEENVWFGVPVAGISKEIRDSRFFIGVRNLNEDYFITDNMSFFTNSSCGIFPTLSTNMPLANYPFSSMCIDYQYQTQTWGIRASIYNGRAYNKWRKNENAFIINPGRDGILQPGEVNYNTQRSKFHLGYALNTKNTLYEKDRVQPWLDEPIVKEKTNLAAFIWQYLEHKIWENDRNDISILCQYSRTLTRNSFCKQYEGAGAVWNFKDRRDRENSLGFFFSAAQFYDKRINEYDIEFTYRHNFTENLYIQPAFHLINFERSFYTIGMLRISYTFDY